MISQPDARRDALVERIFGAALGFMELATIHLGDRLGLYASLDTEPGATPGELAARTATHERYVREWLEQQAVSGLLEVDDAQAQPSARRYRLPKGHAEVLLDVRSLDYMAPLARLSVGLMGPMDELLHVFRHGGGVSWERYGADIREAQADMNRPQFEHKLASEWLAALPDVQTRLAQGPPARVADIACGAGWSSIAVAVAHASVEVDGFDLDGPSIALAEANARAAGVSDRVHFHHADAAVVAGSGAYDLVTVFEAVHDMAQPVAVLRTMRRLAGGTGAVLVLDERSAERFGAPGDELERLLYGWSVLLCLPNGMAEQPSAGTGTVMRIETLRDYALEAGFAEVEVLPVEHEVWRLYRLRGERAPQDRSSRDSDVSALGGQAVDLAREQPQAGLLDQRHLAPS